MTCVSMHPHPGFLPFLLPGRNLRCTVLGKGQVDCSRIRVEEMEVLGVGSRCNLLEAWQSDQRDIQRQLQGDPRVLLRRRTVVLLGGWPVILSRRGSIIILRRVSAMRLTTPVALSRKE